MNRMLNIIKVVPMDKCKTNKWLESNLIKSLLLLSKRALIEVNSPYRYY